MKVITFNGKRIIEPGAYAQTLGGEPDAPDTATFGNVLLIDTGSMAKYGFGSGITGGLASGANSIYKFKSPDDFKKAVNGSIAWDTVSWLFKPSKSLDVKGAESIILVHARTTTKASAKFELKNGGTRATGYITFAAQPSNNDTITMNSVVFTFKTIVVTPATDILIGTNLVETIVNACEVLNASTNASVKVAQYSNTTARITATYKVTGTGGNSYTLAASVATPSAGTLTGGTAGSGTNGGIFAVDCKVEGLGANGNIDPTNAELYNGFAMKLVAGVVDTAKYSVEFYRGVYRGLDWNSVPFDNLDRGTVAPTLLTKTPEFATVQELFAWADTSDEFKSWFIRDTALCSQVGTGALAAGDLTAYTGYVLVGTGTEAYAAGDLTKVYEYIKETDYSFLLSDKYEGSMNDTVNFQDLSHIKLQSEFSRVLVIGGGADSTKFTGSGNSLATAALMNDEKVHICHSRLYKNQTAGKREYPTFYFAAALAGRMAGQAQYEPTTWKDLDFDGVKHEMSQPERETAIQGGVVHMRDVEDLGWVVNLDGNTMQRNIQDIYADGTSPLGSIVRIKNLLNKELVKKARKKFTGATVATADPMDVKSFIEAELKLRTSKKNEKPDLLISYKNVKVSLIGSDYDVKYGFTPNGPINRMFMTGFMFSVNLSA